jgi:pyruvate formate lyase activating enzyme
MVVIKGIQKTTFVDYPGKIAATVFTWGCNFRCVFCHNSSLVDIDKGKELPIIPEAEIIAYLKGRTHQLEGVCISGGEPTIHPDLPEFISQVKALGYSIKLDTNGTNPQMLEALLRDGLLDYIAMDIKGPIGLYSQIVNREVNEADILRSIDIIRDSKVQYEFRTTVLPTFHHDADIDNVGCMLRGAQHYSLQQFRASEGVLNPAFHLAESYTKLELTAMARKFEPFVKKVTVRGIA